MIWQRLTAVLLFLLPIGVLLGPYAAAGPLTLFRLTVAGLTVCAAVIGRHWRHEIWLVGLGIVWLLVGVLSGLVGPVRPAWADLVNLSVGFVLAWSLARLRDAGSVQARPGSALAWLALGWQTAVLISAPVAIWERATTRHLSDFIDGQWVGRPLVYPLPGTFFVNPNYYALFLTVGISVFGYRAVVTRGWRRIWHGALCLIAGALLTLTGAQACVMGLIWMAVGAVLVVRRGVWAVLAAGVIGAVLIVVVAGPRLAEVLRMWQQIWSGQDLGSTSLPVRMALLSFGLRLAVAHPWLGVGPGGFAQLAAQADASRFPLHHKINSHNGIIQVATEYGIPLASCLVLVWAWIGVSCWRRRRQDRPLAGLTLALILSAPLLSVANSLFIGPNVVAVWMALIVLVEAMADTLSQDGRPSRRPPVSSIGESQCES